MSRRAAVVEEFDDDTDLPLPNKPLPNTGARGALLEHIDGSDSDEEDAARRSPIAQARRIPPIGPELPVPCILAADPVCMARPFDITFVL